MKTVILFVIGYALTALPSYAGIYRHALKPAAKLSFVAAKPVLKVSSYPVRHPKKSAKAVGKVIY